jgi:hypothetical protein
MATATLKTAAFGAEKAAQAQKAKTNLLQRFWIAIMEAQLRKAEREIALHLRYIPDDTLKAAGFRRTLEGSKEYPFVK